jgi:hypothetical protein
MRSKNVAFVFCEFIGSVRSFLAGGWLQFIYCYSRTSRGQDEITCNIGKTPMKDNYNRQTFRGTERISTSAVDCSR